MVRRPRRGCLQKFGRLLDMGMGGQEIRSDRDRPMPKSRTKYVRTPIEPPPLFSGVLLSSVEFKHRAGHVA